MSDEELNNRKDNMKLKPVSEIESKEEAQQIAIEWQSWQNEVSMSYQELFDWQQYFRTLAEKFNLVEEFQENGII